MTSAKASFQSCLVLVYETPALSATATSVLAGTDPVKNRKSAA